MISITKTTKKQIKEFDNKEWHGVDVQHFGKTVKWVEKNFIYKATDNGKIVGTIRLKYETGVVYIETIIVAAEKRGQGIGKLLIVKAEKFAKKEKAHKLFLTTGKDWEARKFYESLGFEKVADLPNHHFHKDFVIYSKFV